MKKTHAWRLENPAYGLADSGRLWVLTGFRAMQDRNLRSCPYDKTILVSNEASIIVTTQVDNFIYTGTSVAMKTFESYMRSQFQLSELEYDNFDVYGILFVRGDDGSF
jgi:hypothetical protein